MLKKLNKFVVFHKKCKCFIDVNLIIRYNVEGQLLFMRFLLIV